MIDKLQLFQQEALDNCLDSCMMQEQNIMTAALCLLTIMFFAFFIWALYLERECKRQKKFLREKNLYGKYLEFKSNREDE